MSIFTDPSASTSQTAQNVAVTSLPALPAGSNAIGNVAVTALPALPTGSNDIGTVAVNSLPALPTGSNVIGDVGISGSLPAGSNAIGTVVVTSLPAIPTGANTIGDVGLIAGSAIVGKVGIDQTTPGTTNGVQVIAALPTGSNTIGDVGVTSLPALPAGTNSIGAVTEVELDATIQSPGSAIPSKAIQIAGSDGTNTRAIFTDNNGRPIIYNDRTAGDSTTTALGASGTYTTATPMATDGYSRITGSVYANEAGTLNVEQSADGTNWDISSTFTVSASVGEGFSVELVCPNVRLNYANGATAQTAFRLYSFLRRFA